jgi:inner membrane protein involved in colicin E2 resistance
MKWFCKHCERSAANWSLNGAIIALSSGAFIIGLSLSAALKNLRAGDRFSFSIEIAQAAMFLLLVLFDIAMIHAVVRRLIAQAGQPASPSPSAAKS